MSTYIRYANIDDSHLLGMIHSKSLLSAFKGIIPDEFLENHFTYDRRKEGFVSELSLGKPKTVIMYKDDNPIGLFTFGESRYGSVEDSCIEIWRIYLSPSYWNKGLGSELMDWGFSELRSIGYRKAILWVLEANLNARNFYEKIGFINDGVIQTIDCGKELKELRYSKILDV